MAFDDPGEEERPDTTPPLPPDDRLWRHPSELAGGVPAPAAWSPPSAPQPHRGSRVVVAMASAGLAGALVAAGVMWFARPTRVVVEQGEPTAAKTTATAVFASAGVPSEALATRLAPSLVHVEAEQGSTWSTGTGIRLDDDGTIAVATPVVAGATTVMVTDHDGDRVRAKTIGADAATGITVLIVTGEGGTPVAARSTDAKAGQAVAVIGAASVSSDGTTQQRVVTASVSAIGQRTTVKPIVLHDAVQLDRAVPDDATGGIVVDADGRLVGIVLDGSGAEDLAVVVPADDAMAAARGLRDDGAVRRAWLGVRAVDLSPAAAELMSVKGGAQLTMVQDGSPAAAAGLHQGDVITSVDGDPIGDASDLVVALRQWKPGEQVDVEWRRGAEDGHAAITLGG
ncbi:MAG TPA: S1C family serine protease [Acidimicrobiales bacterium]|nr:S1C family serine protease [Acidimicrobiales bacterium]